MNKFAALLLALAALAYAAPAQASDVVVAQSSFGTLPDGSPVAEYTLRNSVIEVHLISYGARIISIRTPGRAGRPGDVVLGYNDLAGYLADPHSYLGGGTIGRYANRIGGAGFVLDGSTVHLSANNFGNSLHGGDVGFDHRNWSSRALSDGVEFTLVSHDGDMGFPGTLTARVRYTLTGGGNLLLSYSATTDKPTVVNFTNHSYFNLAGGGSILNERLHLAAKYYLPVDALHLPTGSFAPVTATPFDFRKQHDATIGQHLRSPLAAQNAQLSFAKGGFDHTFVLERYHPGRMRHAATLSDDATGRILRIYTTEPGIQFNSGSYLDGSRHGRAGEPYNQFGAVCLETQHFPDSPHHPEWPSPTLRPGQIFTSRTLFSFSLMKR